MNDKIATVAVPLNITLTMILGGSCQPQQTTTQIIPSTLIEAARITAPL
jgi:hypothetical protein